MPNRILSSATPLARLANNLTLVIASTTLLGISIQLRDGLFHPPAMYLLTASFLACGIAVWRRGISAELESGSTIACVIAIAAVVQFVTIVLMPPAVSFRNAPQAMSWFRAMIALVAAATLLLVTPFARRVAIVCMLLGFALIGTNVLRRSPNPYIDTYIQNRDSCDALLKGVNPYTITFPDIYEGNSFTYPPGTVKDGRVMFGYVYPPLPLLLQIPAHVLIGDFRYSQLVAMILTGVILVSMGRLGALAAALLLFTPRSFYVLEMGWIEPFIVLLFAASVWCAMRAPKWLPIPLGLFFASKQHLFLCAPLMLLLASSPREALKLLLKSFAVAAIVSLPLIAWNPRAFFENAILLQFRLPFRDDSSSYLAWIAQRGGPKLPAIIGFVAMAIAMGISLWRLKKGPANFALAAGFSFFALFAFNKQAFCNYYFFIIATLCCAIAVSGQTHRAREEHGR